MARIIIAGGGVCGLAAAMMLADDGHEVEVVERDGAEPPLDPGAAFNQWDRRSVAQFGLGHWLHARGSSILKHQLPNVFHLLRNHGGFQFNLVKYLLALQPDAVIEADDARFDLTTARRSTLEWSLATAAAQHAGVTVRRGGPILGFNTGPSLIADVPHVTGLRLASGEVIQADLVIDATGRRSSTPAWLADVGGAAPVEQGEDSGFAYYGRYFRSDGGGMPPIMAPLLSPIGSFSVLTLPADNNTWSLTLYGLSGDEPLRRFRDPAVYERVLRACPLHAHWLEGEPIGDMAFMAGGVDRHRRFVVEGRPCATGVLTVGDASSCTNPSLGRGMTLGLIHVEALRASIADHLDDPVQLALDFDQRSEAEIQPWHQATTATDRRRLHEMQAHIEGRTFDPDPQAKIGDVLVAAAGRDPIAARAFGDIFSCIATVQEVFARPGLFEHIVSLASVVPVEPLPGPDRAQLLELTAS
jgi:2-polyprenyl-6-methoxyphenol hydroxylase-like FAD-dependent oxidoreductase